MLINVIKKGIIADLGSNGDIDDSVVVGMNVVPWNGKLYGYNAVNDGSSQIGAVYVMDYGLETIVRKGAWIGPGLGANDVDELGFYYCAPVVWNNKIYMYYDGKDDSNVYRICLAISQDGFNFVRKGVVLDKGSSGDADDTHAMHAGACVFRNRIHVFYTGDGGSGNRYHSMQAISKDGFNFVKKGCLMAYTSGDADDYYQFLPNPFVYNNKLWFFYGGYDSSNYRGFIASDGTEVYQFKEFGTTIDLGDGGDIDDGRIYPSGACMWNNRLYLFYRCYDGSYYRAAYVICEL